MDSRTLVFLPTYNERENLVDLIEQLFALGRNLSVLVVDDLSPDGTGELAEKLAEQYRGKIRVIHRDGPRGRGHAGVTGLREAAASPCDYVVEMDADLSHHPSDLPRLLDAASGADLVIGSRYVEGGRTENFGWFRVLNSRVAAGLTWLFLGLGYTDPTSGYRVYRRDLLARLPWDKMISPGPSIVEETLYYIQREGARIAEVPITFRERQEGRSKLNVWIRVRWILAMLRIRRAANS
ncbi:MAG: glycosyltransferase [bacterium]|nr:glycosyltransferase [bacterium]